MRSLILQKVSQTILPVTTLFALYLLLRGHNEPGGGFIAGLVTASALVLQALAFGTESARRRFTMSLRPSTWIGLALAMLAAGLALVQGRPFFSHYHLGFAVEGLGYVDLSTTLLFDVGVYLVVVGATATAISVFAEAPPLVEEEERES